MEVATAWLSGLSKKTNACSTTGNTCSKSPCDVLSADYVSAFKETLDKMRYEFFTLLERYFSSNSEPD